MRIVDLRCAVIGGHPLVRVVNEQGLSGYGQAEFWKPYLKPNILGLRDLLLGLDPTDIERAMLRIRPRGGFKPWGAAVSAVEMALWDLAGKAAGLPAYKLMGGKIRDRVRVYNGGIRRRMAGYSPADHADDMRWTLDRPERFSIIKQPIAFHSPMKREIPGFHYGEIDPAGRHGSLERAPLTERGFRHIVACVEAMKAATGDGVGLALDCGPGFMLADAIRLARALEPFNLLWLEDMLAGDYTPYAGADLYAELTRATITPTHTGEQIYLRQNFKELFERKAVRVIGPDPADVGGLAELKWVAEYADLHGIMIAPHGTANGRIGLAALVQVCATLPENFIAFELPAPGPDWWGDIVSGVPEVKDGMIAVGDAPGLGIAIHAEAARPHLAAEDAGFFD